LSLSVAARRLPVVAMLGVLIVACGATATPAPTATVTPTIAFASPEITPEPTSPPDTANPAETPDRDEAYQQLLVSIPPDIASHCEPAPKGEEFEPGEIGQADCEQPAGSLADYVSYMLFEDATSMNAFFDTQRKGHENGGTAKGPGCGKGPGEGTWENGRKDCYLFITDDAWVMWTHDRLYIEATADRDDGNFAKLEEFWQTAGPVTP
jgi:hypothetical protein